MSVDLDELVVRGTGSSDWAAQFAPAGGSHSGTATIMLTGGRQVLVAHTRAEVLRKTDGHALAPGTQWVSFDLPDSGLPITLSVARIQSVQDTIIPPPSIPGTTWPAVSASRVLIAELVIAAIEDAIAWDITTADTLAAIEYTIAAVGAATWQAATSDAVLSGEYVAAVLRYPGLYPAPIGVYPATDQLAQSPS